MAWRKPLINGSYFMKNLLYPMFDYFSIIGKRQRIQVTTVGFVDVFDYPQLNKDILMHPKLTFKKKKRPL